MKKKSERKLKKEEIRKKLEDAITQKLEMMKAYRETPTKQHLEEIVKNLELDDNESVLIATYNPTTANVRFKGIKCHTSDLIGMALYVYTKATQNDLAGVMDCVSTVLRQEELNECWTEHNEQPQEIKDEENDGKASN